MDSDQINSIKRLAEPIVEQEDMFLVDVEEKGGDETILWIYVDSDQKDITVEACTRISRELSFVLDAHEVTTSRYRLNVSSPGLSRPLTDFRQYRKNRGRTLRVKMKGPDGYEKIEGQLKEVFEDKIEIQAGNDESSLILFETIVEAKIIPKI